ncbi:hypothetical protein D4764_04G0013290 [Takifugu flavidus]|uniref:Uncharacterized protein n=1 Tax=Takifugu flavidus TaxID=433684 RepID=A0A5C6N5C9_9TELE|nr:hypothetical protein D4764_04G0013290 [Takifugu flavidus]
MSFLCTVAGLSLRERVGSSAIWEELGVEPLLLRVEMNQMRWLGHLVRMPPGHLPVWERLGIPLDELEEVAGEREVCASLLGCCPCDPTPDKR